LRVGLGQKNYRLKFIRKIRKTKNAGLWDL